MNSGGASGYRSGADHGHRWYDPRKEAVIRDGRQPGNNDWRPHWRGAFGLGGLRTVRLVSMAGPPLFPGKRMNRRYATLSILLALVALSALGGYYAYERRRHNSTCGR